MCLEWIEENIEFTEAIIRRPFEEDTIFEVARGRGKPKKREYRTFVQLKDDVALIESNSARYNGPAESNEYTALAASIVEAV